MIELAPPIVPFQLGVAVFLSEFVSIALAYVPTRATVGPIADDVVHRCRLRGGIQDPGGIFLLSLVIPIQSEAVGVITQVGEVSGVLTIRYGFWVPVRSTGEASRRYRFCDPPTRTGQAAR